MTKMKNEPIYMAFSTQKGGVGKSAFTVLMASYLHYTKGYNVVVVDCDYPQFSIHAMRDRDRKLVETDDFYKRMAINQFSGLGKRAYPVLCSKPEDAIEVTKDMLDACEGEYDIVFFDLPGTVNSLGVIESLSSLDYIFTPIIADRVEKTDLYRIYEEGIATLGLQLMKSVIPDTKRFRKEMSCDHKLPFRSTLFPADKRLLKGSNVAELIEEICSIIKLDGHGR
jgi:cellulose biosynthesis protein BcsQ